MSENYMCTPTSTVIAAIMTLLILTVGAIAGFTFFYRTKKRQWQKFGSSIDNFSVPSQVLKALEN